MNKIPAFIFDLDGTLSDNKHRVHLIECEKPNWKAYNKLIPKDTALKSSFLVLKALKALYPDHRFLFVTGRPESTRENTTRWLQEHDIIVTYGSDDLLMRKEGDSREDYVVKREIYVNHIEPKYDVVLVLDDRDSVVRMWRKLGLVCHQVCEGNY